jgi:hypothetical protein
MRIARRRPLLRAAAIGGVSYMGAKAGTAAAERQMAGQQQAGAPGQAGAQQQAPPAAPPAPQGAPAPAADTADDRLDQLVKLGQLRDAGVLTEEEFAREKARVLG